MRIAITGANGLLGQTLVHYLAQSKHEFLTTARGPSVASNPIWPHAPLDIRERGEVDRILSDFKPDVVLHAAAMTHVDDCELKPGLCREINVEGTRNVGEVSAKLNAHLINVSTDFIFDGTKQFYNESDLPNPLSVYGASKWEAEQVLDAIPSLSVAHLRTILVYGVTRYEARNNIVLWAKGALEEGKELGIIDDQFRSPTLVDDLAWACIKAAEDKLSGVYHISGPDYVSIYDLVQEIGKFWNLDLSKVSRSTTQKLNQPAKRPPTTGFQLDKAKNDLGYSPRTLIEGFQFVEDKLRAWHSPS